MYSYDPYKQPLLPYRPLGEPSSQCKHTVFSVRYVMYLNVQSRLISVFTTQLTSLLSSERAPQGEYDRSFYSLYRVSRGNVPDFGRMFLTLKHTDLTQNTYIRSWTVTEIIARESVVFLLFHVQYLLSWCVTRTLRMSVLKSGMQST